MFYLKQFSWGFSILGRNLDALSVNLVLFYQYKSSTYKGQAKIKQTKIAVTKI